MVKHLFDQLKIHSSRNRLLSPNPTEQGHTEQGNNVQLPELNPSIPGRQPTSPALIDRSQEIDQPVPTSPLLPPFLPPLLPPPILTPPEPSPHSSSTEQHSAKKRHIEAFKPRPLPPAAPPKSRPAAKAEMPLQAIALPAPVSTEEPPAAPPLESSEVVHSCPLEEVSLASASPAPSIGETDSPPSPPPAEGDSLNAPAPPETDSPPSLATEFPLAPVLPVWTRSAKRPKSAIRWSAVWLTGLGTLGGVTALALVWLMSLPPLPNCQEVTVDSVEVARIYCAQRRASSGEVPDLLAAMELLNNWQSDQPLYQEAQDFIEEWSFQILRQAYHKVEQSDLQGGIELANQIPQHSSVYIQAQEAIASWQEEWKQGEALYAEAQTALQNRQWGLASDLVLELGNLEHGYWREERSNQLTQQVLVEKAAWQTLKQAQTLAKANSPEKLAEAIALVQQVDPNSYAGEEAKTELVKWGEALVKIALRRWKQGDLNGTIAAIQDIPTALITDPVLQDVHLYSQAHTLLESTQAPWEVPPSEVFRFMEAIAALQQIQPDSPLYGRAQADLQSWQPQLQDLTQLQFANLTAGAGQRFAFEWAIQQAQQIQPDRPRRTQAQTLIAYWREQIQRIEDYPYLARARETAQPGDIAALQAAIAMASQIPTDRALWSDAQVAIERWTDQIETLQDKPILQEALAVAQKDDLAGAIAIAKRIGQDRALYDQAQTAIEIWQNKIDEIQIAEDQPILDEAYALAKTERYTLAIETASRIAEGRALYDEAQGAIAQWDMAREAIYEEWAAESESESWSDEGYYDSDPDYDDGY